MDVGIESRRLAVKKIKNLVYTPKSDTALFRKKIEEVFSVVTVPNNVECSEIILGGIKCDELVPDVSSDSRVMVYIHGGSFVGGSRKSCRSICASLANVTSSKVIVPEFSLAPEHPFPKGVEDLNLMLDELRKNVKEIILAADGSGASLAMSLVQTEAEKNSMIFSHIILLSPLLDISEDAIIYTVKKAADDVISSDCVKRCAEVYTYNSNLKNPHVSPMYISQETLSKFPPVYIQCGERELFYPEILKFQDKLHLAHVKNVVDVWPDMIHLFQFADEYLNESHLAIERIGKFFEADEWNY